MTRVFWYFIIITIPAWTFLHPDLCHCFTSSEANANFPPPPSQAHIQRIKDRREAKEEKARYEKMAEKMNRKRVERLKRREKRNKLLNS